MQLAVSSVIFALRAGANPLADAPQTPPGRATNPSATDRKPLGKPLGKPHGEEREGEATLWLPLVRRIREPYRGLWALPGGPLAEHCELEQAARDTLRETTSLDPRYLEQLYAFGGIHRAPDDIERVVSIVYWALVRPDEDDPAFTRENVAWFPVEDLPPLAFDHAAIVEYAVARLRAKLGYTPIAHAFVPPEFTLAELREVYQAVLGAELDRPLDPANFRRQILASGDVEPTGRKVIGTSHRPPRLYRYRPDVVATSPTPPPRSAR